MNLSNGPQFLGCSCFNPWTGVSRHSSEEIYNSLFECYNAYYSGQVDEWRTRMSSSAAVRSGSTFGRASGDCSQPGSCSSSRTGKGGKMMLRVKENLVELFSEENFLLTLLDLYFWFCF